MNEISKNFRGLESASKYEENETKLRLLAQTVLKLQLVEVNTWKKVFKCYLKPKKCD